MMHGTIIIRWKEKNIENHDSYAIGFENQEKEGIEREFRLQSRYH